MLSVFRQTLLAIGFGLLSAIAFVPALASDPAIPAGYESYSTRPDILKLKPKAHPELGSDWAKLRRGHIEAVALLLEMYPDRELYFLARDSELLYDLARWAARDQPATLKRLHLLNISRANMLAEHAKDYLAQEGISEATLKAGKKVLFVDTGFSGTIPRVLSEYFPLELRGNLKTHLMSSSNPDHPSTRVFLTAINPAAPGLPASTLHGTVISYEHMPRYTDRSIGFVKIQGTWQALSPLHSSIDGAVSKEKALAFMEDLLSYASEKETQDLLTKRRSQWKRLHEVASSEQAIQELKALLTANPQDLFAEALARDFVESQQRLGDKSFSKLTVEQVGLEPVLESGSHQSNKNQLIKKYPEWAPILMDPWSGIKSLVEKQEFGKLGAIVDTIQDYEFTEALTQTLGNSMDDPKLLPGVKKFVQMLIEKGDALTLSKLATHVFSQPQAAGMKDLLRPLIEKCDVYTLENLADHAFSNPHLAGMREELSLLVEKGNPKTLEYLAHSTFSKDYWAEERELLRILIENGSSVTHQHLARHVFSKPHSIDKKDLLRLLIEKTDRHALQYLAHSTFSKAHTAGMSDLLKLVIEKADRETLRILAQQTFTQPHAIDFKEVLPLLIEKGDAVVLSTLERRILNQPLWNKPEYQVFRDAIQIEDAEARRAFLVSHWNGDHAIPASGTDCLSNALTRLRDPTSPTQ